MSATPRTPSQASNNRADDVVATCDMLITDLGSLMEEAKRAEGIGHAITSALFSTSDAPNVRELCSEALFDLQQRRTTLHSLEPLRKSQLYLKPFIAACEQKHQRLFPVALSTVAKLVQRRLISHEGRVEIVKMLVTKIEKIREERALLSALQIILALIQDPNYADDEQGIAQLLSMVLRIHEAHAVALPTVAHTAASTVRQAVALIFDHALLSDDHVGVTLGASVKRQLEARVAPGPYTDMDGLSGREVAALKLLRDLTNWAAAIDKPKTPDKDRSISGQWLSCKPPFNEFLLDLLDLILRERAQAFVGVPRFTVALRKEVCPVLGTLLQAALAERLAPTDTVKILRCVGALLRKHVSLAPDMCAEYFQELLQCLHSTSTHILVRCHVLDIFRGIASDSLLIYKLFEMYDKAMEFDLNAVSDMLRAASKYCEQLLRRAADTQNQYRDEYMARLDNYYQYKLYEGKDPGLVVMELHATTVENGADQDVLPAYLSLELSINLMGSLEQLAARLKAPSTFSLLTQDSVASGGSGRLNSLALPAVSALTAPEGHLGTQGSLAMAMAGLVEPQGVATIIDALWRPLMSLMDSYLQVTDRRTETSLVQPLVGAYQHLIYAAGVAKVRPALDTLLSQLCAYALTGPEDKLYKEAKAKAATLEGAAPLVNILSSIQGELVELWPKNRTVIRAVLDLAKRLAEDLGPAWLYVLDVVNCLDRFLELPGAKWKSEIDKPDEGLRRRLDFFFEPEQERPKPGTGKDLLKEKEQWRALCDEIFLVSNRLSSKAVVNLMTMLHKVSATALSSSWKNFYDAANRDMLKQALMVLSVNLHLTKELWVIFLDHCMLVLHSVQASARYAALRYLEEGIMRALSPEAAAAAAAHLPVPSPRAQSVIMMEHHPHVRGMDDRPLGTSEDGATPEGIQRMLLVAVDNLFRDEHVKLDVQLGLLHMVLRVLQRYGEDLTRGWQPLLSLLAAAAESKETAVVTLGWECMHLLCYDYLHMMPKMHTSRALEVLASYAKQDNILNVSLTAVTMLWNMADTLARGKAISQITPATPTPSGSTPGNTPYLPKSYPDIHSIPGVLEYLQDLQAQQGFSGSNEGSGRGTGGGAVGSNEISSEERVVLLLEALRCLSNLSVEPRPEVRTSAVRTLFMAMGSHCCKFGPADLRECLTGMMLPLIQACHKGAHTSSNTILRPQELGKDKEGRAVMMLTHHSRNTEQKQWEESLMLAVSGACRVLRAHLPAFTQLPEWKDTWLDLMHIIGEILALPRKGLSGACTSFISTLLATHAASQHDVLPPWAWRAALQALDKGVVACTGPNNSTMLTVRTELLTCVTQAHAALKDQLAAPDVIMILGWLDRFARYPFGTDDSTVLLGGLGPIQKLALTAFKQLAPPPPGVWPDMIHILCDMLCPWKALQHKPLHQGPVSTRPPLPNNTSNPSSSATTPRRPTITQFTTNGNTTAPLRTGASVQGSSSPSNLKPVAGSVTSPSGHSSNADGEQQPQQTDGDGVKQKGDLKADPRALNTAWMAHTAELAATWYSDHIPAAVKVSTFKPLMSALGECMAIRHVDPGSELWRSAAVAFVKVVEAGLPAINVASHDQARAQQQQSQAAQASSGYSLSSIAGSIAGMMSPATRESGSGGTPQATLSVTVPADCWRVVARAFEMFLLGRSLPGPLPGGAEPNAQLNATRHGGKSRQVSLDQHPQMNSTTGNSKYMDYDDEDSAATPGTRGLSDMDIQQNVLKCLADKVLTECLYMPQDVRAAMVNIFDTGAARPGPGEERILPASRFSHMCLVRLHELSCRDVAPGGGLNGPVLPSRASIPTNHVSLDGAATPKSVRSITTPYARSANNSFSSRTGLDGMLLSHASKDYSIAPSHHSTHSLTGNTAAGAGNAQALPKDLNGRHIIEVAQAALPVFISRCESILHDYMSLDQDLHNRHVFRSVSGPQEAPLEDDPLEQATQDRALLVLELLATLRVSSVVMDALVMARPELRNWVDLARAHKRRSSTPSQAVDKREAAHLVPFYGMCIELSTSQDARIREGVQTVLRTLGNDLGLPSASARFDMSVSV